MFERDDEGLLLAENISEWMDSGTDEVIGKIVSETTSSSNREANI